MKHHRRYYMTENGDDHEPSTGCLAALITLAVVLTIVWVVG